ncbi:unnamed protein product [Lampetra planeri]
MTRSYEDSYSDDLELGQEASTGMTREAAVPYRELPRKVPPQVPPKPTVPFRASRSGRTGAVATVVAAVDQPCGRPLPQAQPHGPLHVLSPPTATTQGPKWGRSPLSSTASSPLLVARPAVIRSVSCPMSHARSPAQSPQFSTEGGAIASLEKDLAECSGEPITRPVRAPGSKYDQAQGEDGKGNVDVAGQPELRRSYSVPASAPPQQQQRQPQHRMMMMTAERGSDVKGQRMEEV